MLCEKSAGLPPHFALDCCSQPDILLTFSFSSCLCDNRSESDNNSSIIDNGDAYDDAINTKNNNSKCNRTNGNDKDNNYS